MVQECFIYILILLNFLNNVSLDNKLMSSVLYNLEVLQYKVACQEIGLIDKVVTGPLWRMMVKEKEVLNMSVHYQAMLDFFKECEQNASSSNFLNGTLRLFSELVVDDD